LRPSQLVEEEETVEDIKKKKKKKRIILLSVTANQLGRVDSLPILLGFRAFCSAYFWRENDKKREREKKTGTDDKDGRVLSCASLWLFSVKTTLWASEWAVNLVNNTHTTRPNPVSQ
jgi:hypothetical protein